VQQRLPIPRPPAVKVMHRADSLADHKSRFQSFGEVSACLQNGWMKLQALGEAGSNRRSQRAASAVGVRSVDPGTTDGVELPTVIEEIDYFVGVGIAFVLKSWAMPSLEQNRSGAQAVKLSCR